MVTSNSLSSIEFSFGGRNVQNCIAEEQLALYPKLLSLYDDRQYLALDVYFKHKSFNLTYGCIWYSTELGISYFVYSHRVCSCLFMEAGACSSQQNCSSCICHLFWFEVIGS